jgi:small subunit ribosomal protein S4
MSGNEHILKRCRALGIEPGYLGYNKKSKRNPKRSNKKISEYGLQLRGKQKAKFVYGVQEKQFRRYFEMADNSKGKTGDVLLQLLESRLDNVVYRLGFASSRTQARMLVTHAAFDVNGRKVNIPSYLVKAGDVISVREIKKENGAIKQAIEANESRPVPTWLERDAAKMTGKVVRLAEREDIDLPVEEHFIVELYSK